MLGYIHSFQSLGTLDGPGLRYVIFFQGCSLRCKCCHNVDTWNIRDGKLIEAKEIIQKATRYKEYFKSTGGITLSGGEPLLQSKFSKEICSLAHKEDIHTCLDTSGSILNEEVKDLLKDVDYVLLDIKYTNEEDYLKYVGCSYQKVLDFLNYLNEQKIITTIRQVIIPSLNDNLENINNLKNLKKKYNCINKIELLPFKKICKVKYDKLNIPFEFNKYNEPSKEMMDKLNEYLLEN